MKSLRSEDLIPVSAARSGIPAIDQISVGGWGVGGGGPSGELVASLIIYNRPEIRSDAVQWLFVGLW